LDPKAEGDPTSGTIKTCGSNHIITNRQINEQMRNICIFMNKFSYIIIYRSM